MASAALLLWVSSEVLAAPALRESFNVFGVRVYPDHEHNHIYYLYPADVQIARSQGGIPEIKLTLTYYTGSQVRDDAERDDVSWALSVVLEREKRPDDLLRRVKEHLSGRSQRAIVVRGLPVRRIPISIDYSPIDSPADIFELGQPRVEQSDTGSDAPPSSSDSTYWSRRIVNIPLERADGAILRAALEAGGATMSLSYSFVSDGYVRKTIDLPEAGRADGVWEFHTEAVGSNSIRVEANPDDIPGIVSVVDLDALAPPGYPGLTIICTDYLTDQSDWLFDETEVRLQAESVSGKPIRTTLRFPPADPEVSLQRASFNYAVRVDKPFQYQVRAFGTDGKKYESDWTDVAHWATPVYASATDHFLISRE